MNYWGPMANVGASRWIADATLTVWRTEKPDLLLTYLPHLDYTGHRAGPGSPPHLEAARNWSRSSRRSSPPPTPTAPASSSSASIRSCRSAARWP